MRELIVIPPRVEVERIRELGRSIVASKASDVFENDGVIFDVAILPLEPPREIHGAVATVLRLAVAQNDGRFQLGVTYRKNADEEWPMRHISFYNVGWPTIFGDGEFSGLNNVNDYPLLPPQIAELSADLGSL